LVTAAEAAAGAADAHLEAVVTDSLKQQQQQQEEQKDTHRFMVLPAAGATQGGCEQQTYKASKSLAVHEAKVQYHVTSMHRA
jgi:hypothetical protein